MKNIHTFFILFLCIHFVAGKQQDEIDTVHGKKIKVADLNDFINHQMDSLNVTGLSVAIIQGNKIIYQGAFGVKNSLTKEKVTNKTVFEAASLSKPVFAYFVMKQVEKGIFDLDKPLYKYFKDPQIEDNENYKLLTGRMVLCHTSGLLNERRDQNEKLKFLFTPGTKYSYSGEGYQCLERVIAAILHSTDIELDKLFQSEIATSIGGGNIGFTWDESFSPLKAFGHKNGLPTDNTSQGPKDWFGAAGGLHTNSSDYANFLIDIIKKEKTGNKVVKQMLSTQKGMPKENGELHRSMAFPIKYVKGRIRYYHAGSNSDFRAYCHFYKEKGYGIVMLSNCDVFLSSNCAQNIMEFLGDKWFYV